MKIKELIKQLKKYENSDKDIEIALYGKIGFQTDGGRDISILSMENLNVIIIQATSTKRENNRTK